MFSRAVAEGVELNCSFRKRSRRVIGVKNRCRSGTSIDSKKHIASWHPVQARTPVGARARARRVR
jgi:hypothetical protein